VVGSLVWDTTNGTSIKACHSRKKEGIMHRKLWAFSLREMAYSLLGTRQRQWPTNVGYMDSKILFFHFQGSQNSINNLGFYSYSLTP
jgi:hypothetical protein